MGKSLIGLFIILIKHRCLSSFRKEEKGMLVFKILLVMILFFACCYSLKIITYSVHGFLLPLIVIISDYTLKFFFKNTYIKVIPYWTLPFKRNNFLNCILLLEIINVWIFCDIVILFYLMSILFEGDSTTVTPLFFLNYYFLIIVNTYCIFFINNFVSKNVSFLLYLAFLLLIVLVYSLILIDELFFFLLILFGVGILLIDRRFLKKAIYTQFEESNV
ncbi:hypothetical protein D0T66_06710 [Dysgonomonas sp. 25]|nr:hypothetical protein [Dysgonomonas sp. 25]